MPKVTKAVIPVAGLGTRMLPASKAIPKEMLTQAYKPLIQYVVNECAADGISEIISVTHSPKYDISSVRTHLRKHSILQFTAKTSASIRWEN